MSQSMIPTIIFNIFKRKRSRRLASSFIMNCFDFFDFLLLLREDKEDKEEEKDEQKQNCIFSSFYYYI